MLTRSTGPAPPSGSPVTLPVIIEEKPVWKKKKILRKTTLAQRVISVCQHNCQDFHVWKNIFAERKFPVLLPGRIFPMWKRWVGNLPASVMTLRSLHQKHKKCHLRTLPHRSVSGILVFLLLCDLSCSRNTFVWKETRWKCCDNNAMSRIRFISCFSVFAWLPLWRRRRRKWKRWRRKTRRMG